MLTVVIANQKGGVGKTTTVLGLASAAQAAGLRTLVIDLDPQANSSAALGVRGSGFTTNDVLYADARGCANDAIWDTEWGETTKAIPAVLELADRDSDTALGAELRLRKALDSTELREAFDLCLIDCPPSVGRLVSNALIAADKVLIVTEPSFMASQGVAKILDTIETVRENYNPDLATAGVILNRVPARSREADFRISEMNDSLGDLVWFPHMPLRTGLSEAVGNGEPIHRRKPALNDCIAIYDAYLKRLTTGEHDDQAETTED